MWNDCYEWPLLNSESAGDAIVDVDDALMVQVLRLKLFLRGHQFIVIANERKDLLQRRPHCLVN